MPQTPTHHRRTPLPHRRAGVTFIELLVAVGILAIIAAIGLTQVEGYRQRSRNAQRVSSAGLLQLALERYRQVNGGYPHQICGDPDARKGWQRLAEMIAPYLPSIPNDPLFQPPPAPSAYWHWHYIVSGANDNYQHYLLQVSLERSGSTTVLNQDKAIKGQIGRNVSTVDPDARSMVFASDTVLAAFACDEYTAYFRDGQTVHCGKWENVDGGQNYYDYCIGNIKTLPPVPYGDGSLDGTPPM